LLMLSLFFRDVRLTRPRVLLRNFFLLPLLHAVLGSPFLCHYPGCIKAPLPFYSAFLPPLFPSCFLLLSVFFIPFSVKCRTQSPPPFVRCSPPPILINFSFADRIHSLKPITWRFSPFHYLSSPLPTPPTPVARSFFLLVYFVLVLPRNSFFLLFFFFRGRWFFRFFPL